MYSDEYERALKYAHRTHAELTPHLDAIADVWDQLPASRKNYHDYIDAAKDHIGVMKDFLDDEGDPRADILHRDLWDSHSSDSVGYWGSNAQADHDDHKYEIGGVSDSKNPQHPVYVSWSAPQLRYGFSGHFTIDEARELADRFPDPVSKTFHKHLDRMEGLDQNP